MSLQIASGRASWKSAMNECIMEFYRLKSLCLCVAALRNLVYRYLPLFVSFSASRCTTCVHFMCVCVCLYAWSRCLSTESTLKLSRFLFAFSLFFLFNIIFFLDFIFRFYSLSLSPPLCLSLFSILMLRVHRVRAKCSHKMNCAECGARFVFLYSLTTIFLTLFVRPWVLLNTRMNVWW